MTEGMGFQVRIDSLLSMTCARGATIAPIWHWGIWPLEQLAILSRLQKAQNTLNFVPIGKKNADRKSNEAFNHVQKIDKFCARKENGGVLEPPPPTP